MEDLEAILAEYGSDEEGELNINGLNLEDILKEADEDDDGFMLPKMGSLVKGRGHDGHPEGLMPLDSSHDELVVVEHGDGDDDDGGVAGGGELSNRDSEDWQQLQEILKAAEDDDDDEVMMGAGGGAGGQGAAHDDIETIISSFYADTVVEGPGREKGGDAIAAVVRSPVMSFISTGASSIPPSSSAVLPTQPPTPSAATTTTSLSNGKDPATAAAAGPALSSPVLSSSLSSSLAASSSGSSRFQSSSLRGLVGLRETRPIGLLKGLELAEAKEQKFLRGGNRDVVSPLQVKRRMRPKASAKGSEGGGPPQAGMVRTEVVDAITKQLDKNAKYVSHGPGVPTALSVHPKFIAIGTKKGLVLLFDHFHEVRNVLGNPAEADIDGPVTSLDVSHSHDLLITGYMSGKLTLWDLLKGVALKAVTDAHRSPLTCVRFASCKEPAVISVDVLGNVNKLNFSKMIWGAYVVDTECLLDGKAGQIPSISILSRITLTTTTSTSTTSDADKAAQQHKDGTTTATSSTTTSTAVSSLASISSLNPLKAAATSVVVVAGVGSSSAAAGKTVTMSLIALSSEKNSFVVSVEPAVKVLYKWEKPPLDMTMGCNPCVSWCWTPTPPSLLVHNNKAADDTSSTKASSSLSPLIPVLARVWGRKVQLLRVVLPKDVPPTSAADPCSLLKYEVLGDTTMATPSSSTGLAVEWIGDSLLAVLDSDSKLHVLDVPSLTPRDVIDLSAMQLLVLSFTPAGLIDPPNNNNATPKGATTTQHNRAMSGGDGSSSSGGSKAPLETYQNCFRRGDAGRLFLLGRRELRTVGLQSWSQRIEALVQTGEWLEALALALDHYEQEVLPTKKQPPPPPAPTDNTTTTTSSKDQQVSSAAKGGGAPPPGGVVTSAEAQISDLLLRYVKLAIENAPKGGTSALSRSHFQMLSGVALEYCLVTNRLDVLYKDVFACFVSAGQARLFLEMLEPYILTDRLKVVGAEALASFIEHYVGRGDLATVERCLLYLHVKDLDFEHVLPLLKRHGMHASLCHVYSRGLGDLLTPLQLLLRELVIVVVDWVRKEASSSSSSSSTADGTTTTTTVEGSPLESLGLKALLYVSYCLQGRSFTSGKPLTDAELSSLHWSSQRPSLLCLLLDPSTPRLPDDCCVPASELAALGTHPYLRLLLAIDCRAVLDVVSAAFDAEDLHFQDEGLDGDFSSPRRPDSPPASTTTASSSSSGTTTTTRPPSKESICHLLSLIIHDPSPPPSPLLSRACSPDSSGLLLDFLAQYMERGHVAMRDADLLNRVLRHLASRANLAKLGPEVCQERLTKVLQRIALEKLDVKGLLPLARDLGFTRAELFLHEASCDRYLKAAAHGGGAAATTLSSAQQQEEAGSGDDGGGAHHLSRAIRCYLADRDPEFKLKVFEYMAGVVATVQQAAMGLTTSSDHNQTPPPVQPHGSPKRVGGGQQPGSQQQDQQQQPTEPPLMAELKRVVLQEMPGLFQLNKVSFLRLTSPLFSGGDAAAKAVLSALDARHDEELQFQYLQAVVNGEVSAVGVGGGSGGGVEGEPLSVTLGPEELMVYVRLMARYQPADVYTYLKTHDDYPLDECLRICQQDRRLMDATAYLLERTGDVVGALKLLLVAISERAAALRAVIRRFNTKQFNALITSIQLGASSSSASSPAGPPPSTTITPTLLRRKGLIRKVVLENMEEGRNLEKMLQVALDLCQRNSARGSDTARYEEEVAKLWFDLLDRLLNENAATKQTALERATSIMDAPQQTSAIIMQAVMNELIQTSLDRMMGFVPLPDIVRKITTDHASNCLGDFRDILLSMFETYTYERNIYSTGVTLMTNTLYRLIKQKHMLRGSGKCVRSVEGVTLPLTKDLRKGIMVPIPARDTRIRVAPNGAVVFERSSEDPETQNSGSGRGNTFMHR